MSFCDFDKQSPDFLNVFDEKISHLYLDRCVIIFIDDTLMFSKNEREYEEYLWMVMRHLELINFLQSIVSVNF